MQAPRKRKGPGGTTEAADDLLYIDQADWESSRTFFSRQVYEHEQPAKRIKCEVVVDGKKRGKAATEAALKGDRAQSKAKPVALKTAANKGGKAVLSTKAASFKAASSTKSVASLKAAASPRKTAASPLKGARNIASPLKASAASPLKASPRKAASRKASVVTPRKNAQVNQDSVITVSTSPDKPAPSGRSPRKQLPVAPHLASPRKVVGSPVKLVSNSPLKRLVKGGPAAIRPRKRSFGQEALVKEEDLLIVS